MQMVSECTYFFGLTLQPLYYRGYVIGYRTVLIIMQLVGHSEPKVGHC